jgi:peroxin-7
MVTKDRFASSSWDGTVKIWQPNIPQSILTLPTHSCTYSTLFSPHSPSILSAVSSDSHLRIFDLRTPASASNHLTLSIPIHAPKRVQQSGPGIPPPQAFPPSEALTHDWNKYRDTIIATAGVDRLIRTFDIRAPHSGPLTILSGHEYAVRKLAWSPHLPDLLLSASYDMTCRVWRDGYNGEAGDTDPMKNGMNPAQAMGQEIGKMSAHTEFVTGVDWCLFGSEGWCASCAWDERICVWDVRAFIH